MRKDHVVDKCWDPGIESLSVSDLVMHHFLWEETTFGDSIKVTWVMGCQKKDTENGTICRFTLYPRRFIDK